MLSDYQTLVTDLVRDDAARISEAQQDSAIATAVARYGADRPRNKAEDLTPVSGNLLALPAGWQAGFSRLQSIEYPIGEVPPTLIEADQWSMYLGTSAEQIAVTSALPAGSTVRANYTIRHVVDDSTDTIPAEDRYAVACFAAASLCDQLAAFYANDSDSTIQADTAKSEPRATAYGRRAKQYRDFYLNHLGLHEQGNQAAGTVVATLGPSRRGTFFHNGAAVLR
jgi:hypothetical protein